MPPGIEVPALSPAAAIAAADRPDAFTLLARRETTVERRVLLVDDDELVLAHLSELVRAAGFDVHSASDGAAALAFLGRQFSPIVITDLDMPAMDGLALCRAIRQQPWQGYVYLLLLTVHDAEEDILAGLAAGADDYLSKRASPAQLLARLNTALRILGLEQALKGELEEKRLQSLTDPLTGANNRRFFEGALQRDFKRAQRSGGALSLLMLDIDHFKHVNDRYGHGAGDLVLQDVVRRMRIALPRETDWCARIGGEEFIVVLGDTPLAGAALVAERIRQAIAAVPTIADAVPISVTVSIGVVEFRRSADRAAESIESLLKQLDANLYLSKQNGRNRVTLPQAAEAATDPRSLRSILYVDDEPDLRIIVQAALSLAEGLTVHTAASGAQGLDMARELRPDLLLLDVMMPGLDGPGTLRLLRADPALAGIPVMFMTAKSTVQDVQRLRALGAMAVIAKPFDPMQLSRQVLTLWQQMAIEPGIAGAPPAPALPVALAAPDAPDAPDAPALNSRPRMQFADLSGKFLARSAVNVETLRQLIDNLQAGAASDVASMHAIAHKMHGAGATLDFPAVSQHAAEIESISRHLLAADANTANTAKTADAAGAGAERASDANVVSRLRASLRQLEHAIMSAASAAAFRSGP
jgi:diguanylate cyclase (GGDEF)-like protein